MRVGNVIVQLSPQRQPSDADSSFSKEGQVEAWHEAPSSVPGRVSHGRSCMMVEEITGLASRQKGQMCMWWGGERGAGDRATVEDSTACEDRMYWQIPLAQGLLGGLGWPEVECSLGTGLLGDPILKPVSGTDLWKNPNLLIWLLTCSSPQYISILFSWSVYGHPSFSFLAPLSFAKPCNLFVCF